MIIYPAPSIIVAAAIRRNIKIAQKIKLIWISFRSMEVCHLSNAIIILTFLKNYKIKNQLTLHNHILIIRIQLISPKERSRPITTITITFRNSRAIRLSHKFKATGATTAINRIWTCSINLVNYCPEEPLKRFLASNLANAQVRRNITDKSVKTAQKVMANNNTLRILDSLGLRMACNRVFLCIRWTTALKTLCWKC